MEGALLERLWQNAIEEGLRGGAKRLRNQGAKKQLAS
jgi:hypothetical protein